MEQALTQLEQMSKQLSDCPGGCHGQPGTSAVVSSGSTKDVPVPLPHAGRPHVQCVLSTSHTAPRRSYSPTRLRTLYQAGGFHQQPPEQQGPLASADPWQPQPHSPCALLPWEQASSHSRSSWLGASSTHVYWELIFPPPTPNPQPSTLSRPWLGEGCRGPRPTVPSGLAQPEPRTTPSWGGEAAGRQSHVESVSGWGLATFPCSPQGHSQLLTPSPGWGVCGLA